MQYRTIRAPARLRFVTQTLLVPIRSHALATLVFGDFCLASFLQGAHRDLVRMPASPHPMQALVGWDRNLVFRLRGTAGQRFA